MEPQELFAQAVGICAMAFNILSYQQKQQKRVIAFQLMGGLLFSVNFFLLGAMVGAILNVVAAVRAVVFLQKEKLNSNHPAWLLGFTIVYFISYVLTFTVFGKAATAANLTVELLPVIGMIATTVSFRYTDAKTIRRYGLISSPCWLIYNIASFSVGAIICEVLSLCSILIGMIRLDRKNR